MSGPDGELCADCYCYVAIDDRQGECHFEPRRVQPVPAQSLDPKTAVLKVVPLPTVTTPDYWCVAGFELKEPQQGKEAPSDGDTSEAA